MEEVDSRLGPVVLEAVGGRALQSVEMVQRLWGGYGQILRCTVDGGSESSVIVKHVRFPDERDHPYGWTSDSSHLRKVESYRVEMAWYRSYSAACDEDLRVPRCLAVESEDDDGVLMVLEDLDSSGFPKRFDPLNLDLEAMTEIDACVSWLASFHARFLGEQPEGLWSTGTYWHLATRADEFDALEDGPLKSAAAAIDRKLAETSFPTLVHGDAKLANFCFSPDGSRVAAVDFQYVGGGCGMKDVAYFISSCLDDEASEAFAPQILDRYFRALRESLAKEGKGVDVDALEEEWRVLYPVAWTDFTRFLHGWSPGHWKLHGYSKRLTDEVLRSL